MLESRQNATPAMFGELLRKASMGDLRDCPVSDAARLEANDTLRSPLQHPPAPSPIPESVWPAAADGSRPPQQSGDHHHRPGVGLGALQPGRGRHPHLGNMPAPGRRKCANVSHLTTVTPAQLCCAARESGRPRFTESMMGGD